MCIRDCAWLQQVRASAELGLNIYLLILSVNVCVVSCGNVCACIPVCTLVCVCVWPLNSDPLCLTPSQHSLLSLKLSGSQKNNSVALSLSLSLFHCCVCLCVRASAYTLGPHSLVIHLYGP